MTAREFYRKNKEIISAPFDDDWMENAVSQMMEAYLSHKIQEAEKANPYKSDSSSRHGIEARLIEHGYNLAINTMRE